ncbi:MAG TPA: ribonuclease III [Phycisphaerales bacterium]|nr:ribonuclease III [Phycisphaerales bacterium]
MTPEELDALQARLGHRFTDVSLLRRALTHASVTDVRKDSNERLEFLGDAVLGLVCCELIYTLYPDFLEGEMTKIKSTVVSRQTCAAIARELELDKHLTLGKGMQGFRALPQSLSAATLESVVAAIYFDAGLGAVRNFLVPLLSPLVLRAADSGHQENFKSVLQQFSQQRFGRSPAYHVLDEKGPDHAKCFEIAVEIDGRRFPSCWGASKKAAEQQAALNALGVLGVTVVQEDGHIRVLNNGHRPR